MLLLLNVTKQEKVFSKIRKGNKEIQKLHERLPVKNYVSVQDNENRKVNKYKDDLSQESEEISEEKPQKQFLKKKQKEVKNFKYHAIKKELKKTYGDNLKTPKYKTKINVEEDHEDISDLKTIKNKRYLDKEGPKKYSKQRIEKSLNQKDKDNDFAGRMKQKTTYEFYEEKGRKGSVSKLRLKKGVGKDDERWVKYFLNSRCKRIRLTR